MSFVGVRLSPWISRRLHIVPHNGTIPALIACCLLVSPLETGLGQEATYTIRHYDLRLTPDFITRRVALQAVVEIANPALDSVFLFGLNDRYESVSVSAGLSAARTERSDGWAAVTLDKPAAEVRIEFGLEGALGQSNDEKREIIADSSLFLLWSDRFYPIDFHRWATVRSVIVLPRGFHAVAPGRLTGQSTSGQLVTHVFETTEPAVSFS